MLSGTLGMSTAVPACQVGGLAFSDIVGTNHCIVMCSYSVNKERNLTISPLLNKPTESTQLRTERPHKQSKWHPSVSCRSDLRT